MDYETESTPKSWSEVQLVVLGDSLFGGLSFKEIPQEERPKLRVRSFKGARVHNLLPMVETEITKYNPDLLVLSVGRSDLTNFGCQHFPGSDHQHHVRGISYDFSVKLAATEIFDAWHSWLSKYSCRVLVVLTYPVDFQMFNVKKLQHCPECKDEYNENGQRDELMKRIKEWGTLLTELDVPVMYMDDVLKRINPDYIETDSVIEESERALIDGMKPNENFAKHFYYEIRAATEKYFPDLIPSESNGTEPESMERNNSSLTEKKEDLNGDGDDDDDGDDKIVLAPPRKKPKPAFRF